MITVDIPESWLVERDVGQFDLLARPRGWRMAPSPVLNVITRRYDGESLDEYAATQVDGLHAALASPRLLELDTTSTELRVLVAFEQNGADLTCYQRQILSEDGRVVVITATAPDDRWPDVAEVMVTAVHSVSV